MYPSRDQARQYLQQQILNASPAQQIVMLYDHAIKFSTKARDAIAAGDIQERHNNNRRSMEIVSYLLEILDVQKGGDVAVRLQKIYSFLLKKHMEVDFRNDARICEEIIGHLKTLRGSWDAIARNDRAQKPADNAPPAPKSAVA